MSLDKPPEIEEKPPAPTPLGDHALARLQRVAHGNGMTREQMEALLIPEKLTQPLRLGS